MAFRICRVSSDRKATRIRAGVIVIGVCLIFALFLYSRTDAHNRLHVAPIGGPIDFQLEMFKYSTSMDKVINMVDSSASSGRTFTGKTIRKFNPRDIKFRNKRYPDTQTGPVRTVKCTRWAVLTTIFSPPSEAVRRFLHMDKWCVVIVGDKNKPSGYVLNSTLKHRHIVFLSDSDQDKMNSKFVENLPWHSFGRKNVGFLYAIAHGAEVIWDFDDDNMLKVWIDGTSPSDRLCIETFIGLKSGQFKSMPIALVTSGVKDESTGSAQLFNPYPLLGAPSNTSWPRGFPLTLIRKSSDQGHFKMTMITAENIEGTVHNIGVLQSLADHEPDVDALYRLIQGTPFNFMRPAHGSDNQPIYLLSKGVYTPFNAQATLHFRNAFLALYLPVTVPGRVSDIWRSYIAQTLLSLRNISIGFMPRPIVDQERNYHSLLADLEAEFALYTQTNAMVAFMDEWHINKTIAGESKTRSLEDLLEELYIETYERGFIEIKDVHLIQKWIIAIRSVCLESQTDANSKTKHGIKENGIITEREEVNIHLGKLIIVT